MPVLFVGRGVCAGLCAYLALALRRFLPSARAAGATPSGSAAISAASSLLSIQEQRYCPTVAPSLATTPPLLMGTKRLLDERMCRTELRHHRGPVA